MTALALYVSPISGRIAFVRSSAYREPTPADLVTFGESCAEALERLFSAHPELDGPELAESLEKYESEK